jgi:hypothetical protein
LIVSLAVLGLHLGTGFLLVSVIAPGLGAALKVSLGTGLGIGAASCCLFLALVTGIPWIVLQLFLLVAIGVATWRSATPKCSPAPMPLTTLEHWLRVALAVVFLCAMYGFVSVTRSNPHGQWDAWAIYNLRARFLATSAWRDGFSLLLYRSHPDYPLLLPGFIASVWRATGERDLLAPAAAAFLFTFGTGGLLVSAVAALKGRAAGFLAGIALMGTPYFIEHGASQYADVPVSFFILATLALLALQDQQWPKATGLSVLAGSTAGMCAWTKNEGLLLIAVLVPFRAVAIWRGCGGRVLLAQSKSFAAGLAPVLAVILYFRFTLATPNDHLREGAALMARLVDLHGWKILWHYLVDYVSTFGGLPVSVFLVLALYLVCTGLDWKRHSLAIHTATGTLLLMLIGYCVVCVVATADVVWQVTTALTRLLLQLWPGLLFLVFLAARNPGREFRTSDQHDAPS